MVSVSGISRTIKAAGKLIFMDPEFSRIAENTLKASRKSQGWSNIHRQVWDSFKVAEKQTYKDSFWKNLWNKQILGFPKDISKAWSSSKGLWGTTKAIGGQLLHRLPIIFTLFELPIILSFKYINPSPVLLAIVFTVSLLIISPPFSIIFPPT